MNGGGAFKGVCWTSLAVGMALILLRSPAAGQNHPELDWQVLETQHFRILFHQGLEGAAAQAADIAEAAYGPVTRLYQYEPGGKVRIVLKDFDDYANGAAYYYLDVIEIWTTALDHDFDMRGTTSWLSNVITHEFVHIVSLGAARKAPQRIPALYLQVFGYQSEKDRADILIGYPDVLASYPVATTIVPMWFAEGVAQYQVAAARQDKWDTHRDMVLRTAVLNDQLLSFDDMGVFEKRGFGSEFVYDHGYGLVRHIASRYGDSALARICAAASNWRNLELDSAIEEVLGVSTTEVYAAWRDSMARHYGDQVASLGALNEGVEITDAGFSNIHPVYSPDGRRLAYLSTMKGHYGPHSLVVRNLETGKDEQIARPAVSSPSWSPDGRRLVFARKDKADKYGSQQSDLYVYDTDGPKRGLSSQLLWALPATVTGHTPENPRLRRISRGLRALYPAFSPDGEWIAFIRNQGANNNLGIMRADGSQIRYLTDFADGTQLYTPRWSPDGRTLALSISRLGRRDIALLRLDNAPVIASADPAQVGAEAQTISTGSDLSPAGDWAFSSGTGQRDGVLEPLVAWGEESTDRDPVWSADGEEIIFASDVTGIFNLYSVHIASSRTRQLTNVTGGALSPTVNEQEGSLAFAAYGPEGFRIRVLSEDSPARSNGAYGSGQSPHRALPAMGLTGPAPDPSDRGTVGPYGVDFLKTLVLPRLMWDEGHFKGGAYASTSDALFKQSLFGGLAVAPSNGDRDLFVLYEYRGWRPTAFLEFYHQKRHTDRGDSTQARDAIVTGLDFSLSQLSTGLRGKVSRHGELTLSATFDRYDASLKWDFFEPRRDGIPGFVRRRQKPVGYTYLNGFGLGLTYRYQAIARRLDREIAPRGGRRIYFRYDRMYNFFLEEFNEQNTSFLEEVYAHLFYNQFTLDWNEFVGLPGNTSMGLRFYGGWVASDVVDDEELINDFFDYHIGGLNFMKGYTFYSIEGRKALMGTATLRFPLLPHIGERFAHLYFDKIYGALFAGLGKAWDEDIHDADAIYGRSGPLRDVGGQLRLDLISYYSMPTRIQADLAYGIDEVGTQSPWKVYFTLLFGYL